MGKNEKGFLPVTGDVSFQEENSWSTAMSLGSMFMGGVGTGLSAAGKTNPAGAVITGAISLGLGIAQMAHTQARYHRDADIAKNAGMVTDWVPISEVSSPNRLILGAELAEPPRQNDVYAVLNAVPDKQQKISKTSRNSTRVYVDYTNTPTAFDVGDYVFLRTECQIINAVGEETFGGGSYHKYIEVEKAFQFMPLENEEVAFIYADGGKLPLSPLYYCYFLNKPKVVRIEIKDSDAVDKNYWTRIDYEYSYYVQGSPMTDSFIDGGFTEDHIEGPYNHSLEASDISLRGATVTTGISNVEEDIDLYKDFTTFSYDEKTFHKGEDSVTRMRQERGSTNWLFVNKTVNALGKPCFNAGYYGVMASFQYEGCDPALSDGGAQWRKRTTYRFDVYGRPVRTLMTSASLEGRKTKSSWTQYAGSSPAIDDIDPLDKFAGNYLSGNYQQMLDAKHALGLVGATIEEVDGQGGVKTTFNGYDAATLNLLMSDTLVISSLRSYADLFSNNVPNFEARYGATVRTDPAQIWWSYGGSADSNDWTTAEFDEDSVSARAITRFAYNPVTNNLTAITKPAGNVIDVAWGTGWKSSYIVRDFRELDANIGGTTQYAVTTYDYDLKGRLVTKTLRFKSDTLDNDTNLYTYGTNATKSVSQYTYDGMDRLLTKIIGDGTTQTPVLKRIYNDAGDGSWANPYTVDTDYLGFRTKSYYDARYRLTSVEKFKPNQNVNGNLDYAAGLEVKISSQWNDWARGIEKVSQAFRYSNVDEAANHAFVTKNSYDSIGRLTRVEVKTTDTNYQGDSVFRTMKEISYDETLNAVVTKDFLDDTTGNFILRRVENDWLGRGPVKEIEWTGLNGTGVQRTTINRYRHDGKLLKKELPNKEAFLYSYDNLGRLEKISYPDGTRTATVYDLNGNVAQTIDRRNLSTTFAYNKSDLAVLRTTVDPVRGNTVVTTTYTQFGPAKIAQTENAAPAVENDYWYHWSGGVLRLQQIVDTYTMQVDNTFDAAGNRITMTPTGSGASPWTKTFNIIPQFHAANPDTDNFNRMAVADNSTGQNIVTLEPDFLGLLKEIKYGTYSSPVGMMSHVYDKFLRLSALHSNEGTRYLDISLTRDFTGNITRRQEPAASPAPAIDYAYAYDGMQRLSSGESESETYDELSNLVTKGAGKYVYQDNDEPGQDQMRLATFDNGTAYNYTYDANGNPTEISNRFTSLSYDSLNLLRQIVHGTTDNYLYNSIGLRVKKTEDATGTWKTTYTLYEGDNILMQEVYMNSGRIQALFNIIVNGQVLAQYKRVYPSTDSVVYFYVDYLGSRRTVINNAGSAIDRYRYPAWGAATQDAGSDDYRSFTGKDYDATGLLYFNARYYDPLTGRFLTQDPAMKGGNWYAYCGNNPLIYNDTSGKEIEWSQGQGVSEKQYKEVLNEANRVMASHTEAGRRFKYVNDSTTKVITIRVNSIGKSEIYPLSRGDVGNKVGSDADFEFNINDTGFYEGESTVKDLGARLVHDISGHGYDIINGISPIKIGLREITATDRLFSEETAVAMENEYRDFKGIVQRPNYDKWEMPIFIHSLGIWVINPQEMGISSSEGKRLIGPAEPWRETWK